MSRFYVKSAVGVPNTAGKMAFRILRHGRCPDGDHQIQGGDGEIAVEIPEDHPPIDDTVHEEVDGVVVSKPLDPAEALLHRRRDRNRRLSASDWTQQPDAPLDMPQRAAWAAYRQALRDLPSQPTDTPWPVAPRRSR